MKKIDHYCILAQKKYSDGIYYFVDGYKTLSTLRKRFNVMRDTLNKISVPHDSIILCSCDEDRKILKIYDKVD